MRKLFASVFFDKGNFIKNNKNRNYTKRPSNLLDTRCNSGS